MSEIVVNKRVSPSKRLQSFQREIPFISIFLQTSLKACRDILEGILRYEHLYGPWRLDVIEESNYEEPTFDVGISSGLRGAIVFAQSRASYRFARKYQGPIVLIDPIDEYFADFDLEKSPRLGSLKYDSSDVGCFGADFLLTKNFSYYAYVDERSGFNWSRERGTAFCQKIGAAGKTCFQYMSGGSKKHGTEKEMADLVEWIRELPKPIGIMAARDVRARQILNICASEGISVPHQVAVLGVDNDPTICLATWPQLSSVQLESRRGGFNVAELLAEMMSAARNGETLPIEKRRIYGAGAFVEERASTDSFCVDNPLVSAALEYIKINVDKGINVKDVADSLFVSRRQLETVFKNSLKRTIISEINRVRCQKACSLLANTDLSVVEIAELCGYDNASYMGKVFKKTFGQTALAFRKRNYNPIAQETPPDDF